MKTHITGNGVKVDRALEAYVRRRIGFALGRFSTRMRRVYVTLIDESGPKGGRNKTCRVRAQLHGLPTVVVEHMDADLHASINQSFGRVGRTVARRLDRALTSKRDRRAGEPTREKPDAA